MVLHGITQVIERVARDDIIMRKGLLEQGFAEGMIEPRCGENEDGSQSGVDSGCDAT